MNFASDLITLDEAARLIPGADADTLKRHARKGTLTVYRPGKAYLTTREDVMRLVESCRVVPKVRDCGFDHHARILPASPALQPGLSEMALASRALDSALTQASKRRRKH